MQQENIPAADPIQFALKMITECYDILFDQAPVMVHSINREGDLVKVNQQWLTTMGYEIDETMGRKSVDFLTDESRVQAITDTLPIFWETGSARGVGYSMVRKSGRTLDVLLDAEAIPENQRDVTTLATLRMPNDAGQRRQALTTLGMLQNLGLIEHWLEVLVATGTLEAPNEDTENKLQRTVLPRLDEVAQEVTSELRNLALLKANEIHAMVNVQANYILLADTIQMSIRQIAGVGEGR